MAKKREIQAASLSRVQQFIQSLNTHFDDNHVVKAQIASAQDYITQLDVIPSIAQQKADIALIFKALNDQPLSKLQFNRLLQQDAQIDAEVRFEKFKTIVETHVQITTDSRGLIDPYYKSEHDYSSRITHYKKWLLNVLCIYLGYLPDAVYTNEALLTEYLAFINRIYEGTTTSRVTLRQAPQIQAEALTDLPRNTVLQVFGKVIHQHWVKVIYTTDSTVLQGYVQLVYLKIPHELTP